MKRIFLFAILVCLQQALLAQVLRPIKLPSAAAPATTSCCGFRAYNSTELPMGVAFSKENTLVFDKELFDDANACNGAAYKAPSDGVYQFIVQLGLKAKNTGAAMSQVLLKIKTAQQSSSKLLNIPPGYDDVISAETSVLFRLQAGEAVSVTGNGLGWRTGDYHRQPQLFFGC
jgi:hypothetical protein